jgi:hypothetical protein
MPSPLTPYQIRISKKRDRGLNRVALRYAYMGASDIEICHIKKTYYVRTRGSKLKIIRRKCEDNFCIPLSLGDCMLLCQYVYESCMNFAVSPLCGGDPGKEGLAKFLVIYHNLQDLASFQEKYEIT